MGDNNKKGFTILELLIVIGILVTLSTTVVLVINPVELLARSRDSKSITELKNVNSALSLYLLKKGLSLGVANTVYTSLPDASATCSSYVLPNLPTGWSYNCKNQQDYKKVDGNGWIPVDLSIISIGSPLSIFPVDSVNDEDHYYTYVADTAKGIWELTARLKSTQYGFGGSKDSSAFDGGDDFTRYEQGTNLQLNPHSFEFAAYADSTSGSQNPGWYHYVGAGTVSVLTDADSPNFLRANGYVWNIWQENIPFDPNVLYELRCRVRQTTDPIDLAKKNIFCGWTGVADDGTTLVNTLGANVNYTQHYHAASLQTLTAGAGYTTFIGYTKGYGSPNGNGSMCPNPSSPCKMHANVRFIRPVFILNYNGGDGVADIDFIISQKR